MAEVVSNTSVLIALATIHQLPILEHLFSKIYIPPAVQLEMRDDVTQNALRTANWLVVRPPKDTLAVQVLQSNLGTGESEAIILAKERSADLILLDDLAARSKAQLLGLRIIGTLGVLILAKSHGYLPLVKPGLDELKKAGFRMSDELCSQVLARAKEVT